MTSFCINSVRREIPESEKLSLEGFLSQVRAQYTSDSAMIISIRVNGSELSEAEEKALSASPLESVGEIEVQTTHPKEFAQETIVTLMDFTRHLEAMSREAGEKALKSGTPGEGFARLIEGVEAFSEGLTGVKKIMRVGFFQPVSILEADLYSILRDVADFQQGGHVEFVADLLIKHLPENLAEWRTKGLPALLRSRDT